MITFLVRMKPLSSALALILAASLSPPPADAARKERLELDLTHIELSGPPAAVVAADINGDGRRDLAVVVAYTQWDQIGIEERTEMDDVQGLVEVLTIVPALLDRRELQVFLAGPDGGYHPAGEPLPIDRSVLSIDAGPPDHPILALTDDGLSSLRLSADGEIRLETVFEERPILARTGSFIANLSWVHDLNADGTPDVLLPTDKGASVILGGSIQPASRLLYPFDGPEARSPRVLHYPVPEVRDVTGDGLPDLVMPHHQTRWENFHVLVNVGDGRFQPAQAPFGAYDPSKKRQEASEEKGEEQQTRLVFFGDLDGDGRAEYVTEEDLSSSDIGWRKELKEAKNPPFRYRLFHMNDDFSLSGEPYAQFETLGYAFGGDDDGDGDGMRIPGGLQDLDGDGRQDLITLTLDFSLLQAVRILTVKSINLGLDFHIWCQTENGAFEAVEGLDLSGRFRLNLNNLKLGQLSQFDGDFDGDGRADFVQMGRGKKVSIHRGREGCFYAAKPDLVIELDEEPRDLSLVKVEDFDGDGLTDLMVIQPQTVTGRGATPPVRLDLYVSGQTKNGGSAP